MMETLLAVLNAGVFIHAVCRLAERQYGVLELRVWAFATMAGGALTGLLAPGHDTSDLLLRGSLVLIGLDQWNPLGLPRPFDRRSP